MTEAKPVAEMTAEECLEELETLSETVEFGEKFGKKTKLADLQRLVEEGRAADEEESDEDDEDEDDDEDLDEDEDVELEESGPKGKGVHVFDKSGKYVRSYTAAKHGKKFRDLAEQFAEKKGYSSKEVK